MSEKGCTARQMCKLNDVIIQNINLVTSFSTLKSSILPRLFSHVFAQFYDYDQILKNIAI